MLLVQKGEHRALVGCSGFFERKTCKICPGVQYVAPAETSTTRWRGCRRGWRSVGRQCRTRKPARWVGRRRGGRRWRGRRRWGRRRYVGRQCRTRKPARWRGRRRWGRRRYVGRQCRTGEERRSGCLTRWRRSRTWIARHDFQPSLCHWLSCSTATDDGCCASCL